MTTPADSTNQLSLTLDQLVGKWHIVLTDFPMWLDGFKSGAKTKPTFNYGLETKKVDGLSDCVEYLNSKGVPDQILGFNTPQNTQNTRFQWRGKGWLWLITSNWDIMNVSDDLSWAVIHFESTLFTPEGYDVIVRDGREVDDTLKALMLNKVQDLGISSQLTDIFANTVSSNNASPTPTPTHVSSPALPPDDINSDSVDAADTTTDVDAADITDNTTDVEATDATSDDVPASQTATDGLVSTTQDDHIQQSPGDSDTLKNE